MFSETACSGNSTCTRAFVFAPDTLKIFIKAFDA